jgi:predicted transcriptional regulator
LIQYGDAVFSFPKLKKGRFMDSRPELVELTTEIVAAYVGANTVATQDLPGVIETVYRSLKGLNTLAEAAEPEARTPAVPVKKSITNDHIVCLEDGKKFKSLKRHLRTRYNMTPEEYRAKWGLAHDYPMVAPNYAQARSDLAKRMGLGKKAPVRAKAPKRREPA